MNVRQLLSIALLALPMMVMAQSDVVKVNGGKLQGVASGNPDVVIFKGVPYAQPPVGELRWKAPQPVKSWKGVRVCDKFGDKSWQGGSAPGTFYWKEFYQDDHYSMNEDCLYLNIWVPKGAINSNEKLPVAFWCHGGAYLNGYGHEITMDGDAYAQRGVILVTINYRLGLLGFLCHPELSKENPNGVSGNYGTMDQIAALQWVHDNISQFGGDPDNITVMGQSAGAASVKTLVISPMSKGLIRHCIIQSGGGLAKFMDNGNNTSALRDAGGKQLMDAAGYTTIKEMRQAAPEDILKLMAWGNAQPHVDGVVLTKSFDEAVLSGEAADIDYMIGCTVDDIMPMNKAIDDFCYARDSVNSQKNVYQYIFARKLPGSRDGSFHSAELWYMFHTLNRSWRPLSADDYKLADEMTDYWTNFCKYGNPNGKGAETWPAFTPQNPFVKTLNIK